MLCFCFPCPSYYLGELLCKLSLLDPPTFAHFTPSAHPHALTANWGYLSAALRNQGVKCGAQTVQDIMHAKVGAALKLVYQVKMAVQRREQSQAQQAMFAGGAAASPSKSKTTASLPSIAGAERTAGSGSALGFTASTTLGGPGATAAFTSPKGHQPSRPFDRLEQRRLTENLLHLSHANKKEKHMDIHLAPFAKAAAVAEEKVREEALRADEIRLQELRAAQLEAREKLQANMAYTRSWNSGGMHIWRDNMDRIDATKAARKQWAASQATKANQEAYLRGREKQHEVSTGIDQFEKNLERIGGAKSSAGAASSSAQVEAEEGGYANYTGPAGEASAVQAMSVKLAASLGSPAQLAKQSAEHMARIHDKVSSDALARKERDRRRRRVLVKQGAQSAALEDANRQELFLEKLTKECAEERAIGEEVWRTNQLYEVIKSNTAYREAQEAAVREEQQRRIVAQQASHYASIKADHERALAAELSRFQEVRLEVAAQKHEENILYAQQLVSRIVDVAHKAVCFREVSEQALIPPPMWREWMSLFVQGLPLLPAEGGEHDEDRANLESLHPAATASSSPSAASLGMDLEASLPLSLLSAMVPARPRTTMGAATPKTPSGSSKAKDGSSSSAAAPKPGSAAALAAAAAAQAEFDSQSLTTDAFYVSLHLNREVSRLMSSLRDVNPSTAEVVDAEALEDYLAARNEWSYDIKEVAPPELVNVQNGAGSPVAAAAASSLSPTPRSRSRPGSSAGSSVSGSKKTLLGSSPEPAEDGGKKSPAVGGSKKAKELAAAAAAAAAAEAAASGHQPFTSLAFLPPLHPADTFDLSEPLPPVDAPSTVVSASTATPASHNPLFGALLQRILDVASGKESPPDLPDLPRFPLAIALLGKPYSGRSTQAAALSEKYGLAVLRPELMVPEAVAELDALEAAPTGPGGEKLSARAEKKAAAAAAAAAAASGSSDATAGSRKSPASGKVVKSPYHQLLIRMKKMLAKSEPLSDDILVGLIVESIRRLPDRVAVAKAEAAAARAQRIQDATDPTTGEVHDESVRAMMMAGEDDPSRPLVAGEGGFVLLGFPSTAAQARLLEQALSGFEPPKPPSTKSTGAPRLGKSKAGKDAKLSSKIARAPTPPPQQGVYPSAFHLVLRLEQENEVLLRRALGRRVDPLTNRAFHLDYAQPTEADMHPAASIAAGSAPIFKAEALTLKSRLQPLSSEVDYHARLPELFLNWEAEQPALQEWFAMFGTLHSLPGCSSDQQPLSIESVRESIRELVRAKMEELDLKAVEDDRARAEAERAAAIAAGEVVPPPLHPLEAALVEAPNRAAAEAYAAQQAALAAEEAAQPIAPAPTGSRKQGDGSKKDASASASKDKDRASAAAGGDSNAESDQLIPPASYPVFTGAELYSFASSGFFDLSLSSFLLSKWELCESNYLRQSKHVFRALRAIRAQNLEYFASTRRNFFAFLRRPDSKTLALQSFQTAFNSLPQDLRADPATKDELHMRLDELGEALWRINSAKHEENEAEFARIVSGGNSLGSTSPPNSFIESQTGSFFFYYALLAQLELDRYLQVIKIAQDFFASLKGVVVHEERFERDEKMEKKRAAAAAAAAAGATATTGAEGETSRGFAAAAGSSSGALGEPRGGLGLKLHINLPLRISQGDPKVRAARKKELEAQKKKDATAASSASASSAAASAAGSSAAPSASSSSTSLAKDGSSKKSKGGALPSARKRFSPSSGSVMSFDPLNGEEDPFSEIIEVIRGNFIAPEEALEQFSTNTDLESLIASVAGSGGTSRGGAKGKKPVGAAAAGAGATKPPGTPGTAAGSAAARGASAGKKRGGKGGAVVPASSGPPRPASREALLDAQFRALVTRENQILSARIRRIHRNAHLELSQLKYYNEKLFLPKLDAYLELRIRGESTAIDSLLYYVRTRIEEERCLTHAIRLEGENAFIDQDVLAVPSPESAVPTFVSGFSDLFDPLYSTRLTYAQLIHVANTLRSLSVGGAAGLDVKAAEVYALLMAQFQATHTNGASGASASFYPIAGEQNLPVKWSPAAIAAASASDSNNAFASHSSSVASLPAAQSSIGANSSAMTRGLLATGSVQAYFRSLVGMFAGGADPTPRPLASGQPAFKHAYIDFRDLMVSCTLLDSIATPSIGQLRAMQALYIHADTDRDGCLSWPEFSAVPLWFESGPTGDDGQLTVAQKQARMESERRTVEPIKRLKEFFFRKEKHTKHTGSRTSIDPITASCCLVLTVSILRCVLLLSADLFASEVDRPSDSATIVGAGAPVHRPFLLNSLDFLLYLCFDDDASSEASAGGSSAAAKSGQEKAALLCGQQPQPTWSAITQAFVHRYVSPPQPNTHGSKQRHTSTSMASTTAAEKFTRKDLTKAAQAQASA